MLSIKTSKPITRIPQQIMCYKVYHKEAFSKIQKHKIKTFLLTNVKKDLIHLKTKIDLLETVIDEELDLFLKNEKVDPEYVSDVTDITRNILPDDF